MSTPRDPKTIDNYEDLLTEVIRHIEATPNNCPSYGDIFQILDPLMDQLVHAGATVLHDIIYHKLADDIAAHPRYGEDWGS